MVLVIPVYSSDNISDFTLLNVTGKKFQQNQSNKTIWNYNSGDSFLKRSKKWKPNASVDKLHIQSTTSYEDLDEFIDSYKMKSVSTISLSNTSNANNALKKSHLDDLYDGELVKSTSVFTSIFADDGGGSTTEIYNNNSSGTSNTTKSNLLNVAKKKIHNPFEFEKSTKDLTSAPTRSKVLKFNEKLIDINQASTHTLKSDKTSIRTTESLNYSKAKKESKPIIYSQHIDSLNEENSFLLGLNDNSIIDDENSQIMSNVSIKDNFVIKICNEIKHYKALNHEFESISKQSFASRTSKLSSIAETPKPLKQLVPQEIKEDFINDDESMQSYFDSKFNQNDFNYKYPRVVSKTFEQAISQYDGILPVEVSVKSLVPNHDYFNKLQMYNNNNNNNNNSQSSPEDPLKARKSARKSARQTDQEEPEINKDYEMYNLLKRMMVKKKYELATIRTEKANLAERRKRKILSITNNSVNSNLSNQRLPSRPKSSLGHHNSVDIKSFPDNDDEEGDTDSYVTCTRCKSCKKKIVCESKSKQTYEDFQQSNEIRKNFPLEVDYDQYAKQTKPQSVLQPSIMQKKCLSCSKSINANPFVSKSESCLKDSSSQSQAKFQTNTFNSNKRSISAKPKPIVEQVTIQDPNEKRPKTCAHLKLMNANEFLAHQRKKILLPGKTFTSQRRQSITIPRPPLAMIKSEYLRENSLASISVKPEREKSSLVEVKPRIINFRLKELKTESSPNVSLLLSTRNKSKSDEQAVSTTKLNSAYQVYKRTTKMIQKRPITAK